jgi:hypothetical protein
VCAGPRGPRQQFAKEAQRNVEPAPYFLRQAFVVLGAAHQGLKATNGELGGGIVGECAKHILVSAAQQYVGDRDADLWARRNRQQVRLRFRTGDLDQIAFAQPPRTSVGAFWIGARRRPSSVSARDSMRLIRWPITSSNDVDLPIRESLRIGDEQIRDTPQRVDAPVFRAAAQRLFQLDNERLRLPHAHDDGASSTRGGDWDLRSVGNIRPHD